MKLDINRKCFICETPLTGLKRRFCSKRCKNVESNHRLQDYLQQLTRATERKLELIRMRGNKCQECGYDKNYAALTFHHRDPTTKLFEIDARACANRKWELILAEAEKCDLLCFNCHMEEHYPHCILVADAGLEPATSSL